MVVATGFFDGVHLGHRLTIDRLVEVAGTTGDQSMVVTFWPHPRTVLQKDASTLRLLTSLREKRELLLQAGVDRVEVVEFTREFSALTAEQYLREYVIGRYGGRAIVLGYDNKFGSDCADTESVAAVARRLGLEVHIGERLSSAESDSCSAGCSGTEDGPAISSTRIRRAISEGDMEAAAGMLGYDYSLYGVVVSGNRIGRTLGFPTANMLLYEPLKLVPQNGAYLVKVNVLHRELYGMCNIGTRPTIGPYNARTIETNIFDFDEDIYGLGLRVTFLRKIRNETKFDSIDALTAQLTNDRDYCKRLIVNY
ncbi:MAG: riboflavin biosynthesis protein RibF [Bacteroidales bacterium]|nr:riboflavin biosynthesis protein RibF [Bacteroidales bacterium]